MANNRYHLFGIGLFAVTRTRVLMLLLFLLFAGSSIGFAIWDNTDTTFDDNIIIIGDYAELSVVKVTENPGNDLRLVPFGAFKGQGDIDHFIYEYVVLFNQEGILEISAIDVRINGAVGLANLVRFSYALHHGAEFLEADQFSIDLSYDNEYYNEELNVFIVPIYVKMYLVNNESIDSYISLLENATITYEMTFITKRNDTE